MKKGVLKSIVEYVKNSCAGGSFLIKRLRHRCFPVNLVKFLRTPFYGTPSVADSRKNRTFSSVGLDEKMIFHTRCIDV